MFLSLSPFFLDDVFRYLLQTVASFYFWNVALSLGFSTALVLRVVYDSAVFLSAEALLAFFRPKPSKLDDTKTHEE